MPNTRRTHSPNVGTFLANLEGKLSHMVLTDLSEPMACVLPFRSSMNLQLLLPQ
jgi:hypothetical protein